MTTVKMKVDLQPTETEKAQAIKDFAALLPELKLSVFINIKPDAKLERLARIEALLKNPALEMTAKRQLIAVLQLYEPPTPLAIETMDEAARILDNWNTPPW